LLTNSALVRTRDDFLYYYQTLANVLNSRAKALYVCPPWSYCTVDWTRWRHKTTAQRGPVPSSCIGLRTC